MPTVHPSAIVDPAASLADDVTVGPFSIIGPQVTLGPGCVVGPRVTLLGDTTAGPGNTFHACAVLGDWPQHLAYKGEPSRVVIGSGNTFREGVTVHRAMPGNATVIGDRNFFMANSHVGHDAVIGNDCILANGALVGGHATLGDRVFLSGNTGVHQFCRVGDLSMIGASSSVSQDLVPFWIVHGRINELHGVNVVGMRRAGYSREEITAVREAYKLLNRSGLTIPYAVAEMEARYGTLSSIQKVVAFIRQTKRGIATGHTPVRSRPANEEV
jgi:UDP-N-acetylglucosamine acyltransferase